MYRVQICSRRHQNGSCKFQSKNWTVLYKNPRIRVNNSNISLISENKIIFLAIIERIDVNSFAEAHCDVECVVSVFLWNRNISLLRKDQFLTTVTYNRLSGD